MTQTFVWQLEISKLLVCSSNHLELCCVPDASKATLPTDPGEAKGTQTTANGCSNAVRPIYSPWRVACFLLASSACIVSVYLSCVPFVLWREQGRAAGKRALADSGESDDSDGASSQDDDDIPLTVDASPSCADHSCTYQQ